MLLDVKINKKAPTEVSAGHDVAIDISLSTLILEFQSII